MFLLPVQNYTLQSLTFPQPTPAFIDSNLRLPSTSTSKKPLPNNYKNNDYPASLLPQRRVDKKKTSLRTPSRSESSTVAAHKLPCARARRGEDQYPESSIPVAPLPPPPRAVVVSRVQPRGHASRRRPVVPAPALAR